MILRSDLLLWSSILLFHAGAIDTRSADARPRGVGPEFAKFYRTAGTDTFTCISNPSITIPYSQVNDDFCDCPDGSDEPGTAACSYLSSLSPKQYHPGPDSAAGTVNVTPALPGFYCKNKGHMPSYVRFESVNDGKCDYDLCCDGSDEWANVGGIKCEDKCKEIGKAYRKNEEIRQKAQLSALKKRNELATEAARLKKEVELKIEALEITIKGHEIKVKQAEDTANEVERREKLRVVKGGAVSRGGGRIGVLSSLAKERINELRTNLAKTKTQRDAMVERITELEDLLTSLKNDYNPNFNDEAVKRVVHGWEDYAARETDDGWTEAEDRDLESIMREDSEEIGINFAEFESDMSEPESDVAALYSLNAYLPPSLRTWLDEKYSKLRQILVENGILAASGASSIAAESKAVQDAKQRLTDAQNELRNAQNDLSGAKDDLSKDYGPDSIFRALKDKCVQKDSGEYTYELCFLASTKQISKKGGGGTNMGNFAGFDIEVTDENIPIDGRGLGKGEKIVLKYENGQHCWNGPNRSTRVVLACAEQDEIWKVSESEKCVYRMEVGTPAACEKVVPAADKKKDEL